MSSSTKNNISSPSKRRRILSDIVNTNSGSLGFDMVNINHSDAEWKHSATSNIPLPSREAGSDVSHSEGRLTYRNKENSKIPTKVDSYIAMNTSLTEKSKIRLPKFEVSYERDRLQENARVERELDALRAKLKGLDEELLRAANGLHSLLDTNEELQSQIRHLLRRRGELREQNRRAQKDFDDTEARVNSNVAHEEKMMHLQLEELMLKLKDDYNEAKFQLEQQVKETQFVDHELTGQGETLQKEKEKLEQQLQEVIDRKINSLAAEQKAMDEELQETLHEKRQIVEKATATYHEKQERFDKVMKEYEEISKEVENRKLTASDISTQMDELNRKIDTFEETKKLHEHHLQCLNDELRNLQGDDLDWQAKLLAEKEKYLVVCHRHENYMATRRILEHSIMNFSNRARLFVRISGDDLILVDERDAVVGGVQYQFDKVGLLEEDDDDDKYSLEWKLLSNEALMKNDVSIIFSGSVRKTPSYNLINAFSYLSDTEARYTHYGWTIGYNVQSLVIDSTAVDILNNSTETALDFLGKKLNVISQRMTINSLSDLIAIKEADVTDKAVCHIITTVACKDSKISSHQLFILNVSNISPMLQSQYFEASGDGILQQLLNYLASNTKVINVCDITTEHHKLLHQVSTFHR